MKDNVNKKSKENNYNYGMDVLKIIATMMIILLHVLSHGGVIMGTKVGSINYYIVWLLESICYVGVNLYALGTGYLNVNKEIKTHSFIKRWMQVFFYTVGFTALFAIFKPSAVSFKSWIKAFIPIMSNQYWYFTQYFVLFMVMPFLNKFIHSIDKSTHKKVILTMILIFSIIPMIRQYDLFLTGHGFSAIWLINLYIIGAYLALYKDELKYKKRTLYLTIIVSNAIVILSKYGIDYLTHIQKNNMSNLFLIDYTSLPILLSSIAITLLCVNMKIERIKKFIQVLGKTTFGIYLIHVNTFVWTYILSDLFVFASSLNPDLMVLSVISCAFAIFIVSMIIEYTRIKLFEVIKINKLAQWIGLKIDNVVMKHI